MEEDPLMEEQEDVGKCPIKCSTFLRRCMEGNVPRASLSPSDHYLGKGSSPGGHSSLGIGVSPRPSNPDALFVLKDRNHSFRYPVIR